METRKNLNHSNILARRYVPKSNIIVVQNPVCNELTTLIHMCFLDLRIPFMHFFYFSIVFSIINRVILRLFFWTSAIFLKKNFRFLLSLYFILKI